ncbi:MULTISPECIES: hypothetical protein [Nocardia]|uniref:hypothetical protein n=1 Tax=Nocardia TaxID=1817 RepID=UPI003558A1C6
MSGDPAGRGSAVSAAASIRRARGKSFDWSASSRGAGRSESAGTPRARRMSAVQPMKPVNSASSST